MNNAATVDEKRADFYGGTSIWNRKALEERKIK